MDRKHLPVVLGALLGVLAGIALFRLQSASLPWINEWGVVSLTFLGMSFGCLMASDRADRLGW